MAKTLDFGSYITVTTELFDALNHAGLLQPLTSELPANYYIKRHMNKGYAFNTYGVECARGTNIQVWLINKP